VVGVRDYFGGSSNWIVLPDLPTGKVTKYDNPPIVNKPKEAVTPAVVTEEITPSTVVEHSRSNLTNSIDKDKIKNNPSPAEVAPLTREQPTAITKLDVVTELVRELSHPSPTKRRKAIWELAQRADSRAMKPLVELMIEADSQERSLILEAVSQIASRTLKPMNKALAISLEDPNSQVRKNAIRDLTRVYDLMTQVSQRLSYSLDDPDNEVRETAKWALKQLNQLPSSVNLENFGKEGNSNNS
jgi:HEAT repeat protein